MIEDRFTHTEGGAGLYERQRAQDDYDDDRPSPSDLADALPIEVRDPRCFTEPPF